MSLKKAATDLLKLADDIEAQANEVTQFVCDKCNHTASLAKINGTRKTMAKEAGENVTVSEITVEDTIACPACEGVMAYKETEESKGFYFDEKAAAVTPKEIAEEKKETPKQQAEEEQGKKLHEEPHGKKEAAIDYDQLDRYMKG